MKTQDFRLTGSVSWVATQGFTFAFGRDNEPCLPFQYTYQRIDTHIHHSAANKEYQVKIQVLPFLLVAATSFFIFGAQGNLSQSAMVSDANSGSFSFSEDVNFLKKHTNVIVLRDAANVAQIAVAPQWQGRVMTSTVDHRSGRGFGWINRPLISSGHIATHINPFGGEDRVWLGPEGGQFSIYFAKGAPFDYEHWFVPEALDTRPFHVVSHSRNKVSFEEPFTLTNRFGTRFEILIRREVHLLESTEAWGDLGVAAEPHLALVAYESKNDLINVGKDKWDRNTGLLSIWILGMFSPSPSCTIVVPIKNGPEASLGNKVNSDYFGEIPTTRLKTTEDAVFLRADGRFRSKIGINPLRSLGRLGSYDADNHVLTIVHFDQPEGMNGYVNSQWKIQSDPFGGDVANAYNDGAPTPGAKPLGPFFEMESSSPAAALSPGSKISHVHRTMHFTGPESELDSIARKLLGVSLMNIQTAFNNNR